MCSCSNLSWIWKQKTVTQIAISQSLYFSYSYNFALNILTITIADWLTGFLLLLSFPTKNSSDALIITIGALKKPKLFKLILPSCLQLSQAASIEFSNWTCRCDDDSQLGGRFHCAGNLAIIFGELNRVKCQSRDAAVSYTHLTLPTIYSV